MTTELKRAELVETIEDLAVNIESGLDTVNRIVRDEYFINLKKLNKKLDDISDMAVTKSNLIVQLDKIDRSIERTEKIKQFFKMA